MPLGDKGVGCERGINGHRYVALRILGKWKRRSVDS